MSDPVSDHPDQTASQPYRSIAFGEAHAACNELFNIHIARCFAPDECEWIIEQSNAHGSWTTEARRSTHARASPA